MLPDNTFVVIGPESTGKTTLCEKLSAYFQCPWINEYARIYLEQKQESYDYDDVIHIAQKQIELENNAFAPNNILFIDTDLIITKVWLLHVYKQYSEWIDEYLRNVHRKAYLICYPDIPWQFDPLRENPHIRKFLFNWYVSEVEKLHIPYYIIKGIGQQRIDNAKAILYNLVR